MGGRAERMTVLQSKVKWEKLDVEGRTEGRSQFYRDSHLGTQG